MGSMDDRASPDLDLSNLVLALPDYSHLSEAEITSKLDENPQEQAQPVRMKDRSPLPEGAPESTWLPCVFYTP